MLNYQSMVKSSNTHNFLSVYPDSEFQAFLPPVEVLFTPGEFSGITPQSSSLLSSSLYETVRPGAAAFKASIRGGVGGPRPLTGLGKRLLLLA